MKSDPLYWDVTNKNFCIWDWNLKSGNINLSSNWLEILGLELEDHIPTSEWFNSILHKEDLPLVLFKLESQLNQLQNDGPFYFRLKHKDGSYLSFRSHGMIVLQNPEGHPTHVIWGNEWSLEDAFH